MLAKQTKLSEVQINYWFSNARRRRLRNEKQSQNLIVTKKNKKIVSQIYNQQNLLTHLQILLLGASVDAGVLFRAAPEQSSRSANINVTSTTTRDIPNGKSARLCV